MNFIKILSLLVTITSIVIVIFYYSNLSSPKIINSETQFQKEHFDKSKETKPQENKSVNVVSSQTFLIKVIFSGIFCIAALFVILSKKYDEETKKWAFSILTLIAGVWIGSVS